MEARVDGTDASTTFAFTIQETPEIPEVSAEAARSGVKTAILNDALEDENLHLHGPVLLPSGAQIFPAHFSEKNDAAYPIVIEESSWLLWIDDSPLAEFAHGVRYVLLSASGASENARGTGPGFAAAMVAISDSPHQPAGVVIAASIRF